MVMKCSQPFEILHISYHYLKPLIDRRISVLDKHLGILVEPLSSLCGSSHTALAVALSAGLDPDKCVDDSVVGLGGGNRTESGGLDVAPLTPV